MKRAWFFRLFGKDGETAGPHAAYDPVYGLPRSEVDAWLARNPELRRRHEAELLRRKGAQ